MADADSTFVAMKEQREIMNEKAGQSLLKGLGMLVDDTVQWEGKVAVEKFAETCQWEVTACQYTLMIHLINISPYHYIFPF